MPQRGVLCRSRSTTNRILCEISLPLELGAAEVQVFLTHPAVNRRRAASTPNQALPSIVFMYGEVLERDPGEFGEFPRARRSKRLPVVPAKAVVHAASDRRDGTRDVVRRSFLYDRQGRASLRRKVCAGPGIFGAVIFKIPRVAAETPAHVRCRVSHLRERRTTISLARRDT